MAILNYTTGIEAEKTISEIQSILVKHGASKVSTDFINKLPCSVTFCLILNGNTVGFVLPANYSGVLKAMKKDRKVPDRMCTPEQALRVSWRIVKNWVEAQCAITEAELADMAEVFLPYAVTRSGNTMYKEVKENNSILLLQ